MRVSEITVRQQGGERVETPPRRAIVVFACVCVGYLIARWLPIAPAAVWFSGACASAAAAGAWGGRACKVALCVGAVCFGGGWWTCRVAERPIDLLWAMMDSPRVSAGARDLVVSVEGIALDEPRASPISGAMAAFGQREPFGQFRFEVSAIRTDRGWVGCSGVAWARARGTTWDATHGLGGFGVHAGDRVRVTARGEPTHGPSNPGEADRRMIGVAEGVVGSIRIDSPALFEPAPGAGPTLVSARAYLLGAAARTRELSCRLLDSGVVASNDPEAARRADRARAVLASLFLGVREAGEPEVRAEFTRLGLAHALAISGFHVAVAVGVALLLVRITGDRGRLEPVLLAMLVGAYLVLVPAEAPVVRAAVMVLVALLSRAMGRRYDDLNTLAWTGLGLLIWRPMDLWSLGFQLSLGLTGLLLWQGKAFHARLFGDRILGLSQPAMGTNAVLDGVRTVREAAARALSAGVLCTAVSAPLIAVTTGMVSPLAAVVGLAVLPLVVVLMWAGYAMLVAGLAAAILGIDLSSWTSAVLGPIASGIARFVGWLDRVPGTNFQAPPLSAWWGAAATVALLLWVVRWHARVKAAWVVSALVAGWGFTEWLWPRVGEARVRVTMTELSLGSGVCTVLESAGEAVLWNCGGTPSSGGRIILRAAREVDVFRARTVVLVGDDLASMAALPEVAAPLGVRDVWLSPAFVEQAAKDPEGRAAWMLEWLATHGIATHEVHDRETVRFGAASLTFRVCSAAPGGAGVERVPPSALIGVLRVEPGTLGSVGTAGGVVLASELGDRNAPALAALAGDIHATLAQWPRHSGAHVATGTLMDRTGAAIAITTLPVAETNARDPHMANLAISTRSSGAVSVLIREDGWARVRTLRPRDQELPERSRFNSAE